MGSKGTYRSPRAAVRKPAKLQNGLQALVKLRSLDPTPRVSDLVGLAWGLRICIADQFPGDADAAGPGPMLRSCLIWGSSSPRPVRRSPEARAGRARSGHTGRQETSHRPGLQAYQRGALLRPEAPPQASPPSLPPLVWPSAPALRRPLHPALFAFLESASAWAVGMSMRAAWCSPGGWPCAPGLLGWVRGGHAGLTEQAW